MRFEVITCWYNEEFLAPYFLKHYNWADKITVLLETATTDRTEAILREDERVNIISFTMAGGIDDALKSCLITTEYRRSDADWVLIADADEFAFVNKEDIEKIGMEYNMARIALYHVYRHATEHDLNSNKSIRGQRRHGYLEPQYTKPALVRTGLNFAWGAGHHEIFGKALQYPEIFTGAHWANADPCFCVQRRLKNRDRQSLINLQSGMSIQNHNITEENIIAECKRHENDEVVWEAEAKIIFGCMVNSPQRLDSILRRSEIEGMICYTIDDPESAAKGLNKLLDVIESKGGDIAVLTHQDMYYHAKWLGFVTSQLALLPDNWIVAGIVGKDMNGDLCGRFHDMSTPIWIISDHQFPAECSCLDECCIIVNIESGFRFDEALEGFDLYGTYACARAREMGAVPWIIDAWAEHYCGRFHRGWEPDNRFKSAWKWLYERFPGQYLDSTVIAGKGLHLAA